MVKFICSHCGYKKESEINIKKCPYCNKDSLERERNAEELVNEIDELLASKEEKD